MADYNKVILIGNMTKDVELKYTPNGVAVGDCSIAVNNVRMVNEEKVTDTTYIDFTVWNKQAENLSKYQKKGSSIMIDGHLKLDMWDDKDTGKKRSKLCVVADRIQYLGGKSEGQDTSFGTQQQAREKVSQTLQTQAPDVHDAFNVTNGAEDDIPF